MQRPALALLTLLAALPARAQAVPSAAPAPAPAAQAAPAPSQAAPAPSPALQAALADPGRGDVAKIDARRHPAELLAFAGAKPGDAIADLIPGSGYFSRIFSKLAGPTGHVYLIWPAEYAKEDVADVTATKALAANPAYANITLLTQPAAAFTAPQKLDLVFTAQNYHDYPDAFMGKLDPAVLNRAVFAALKPGGVFLVIDHAAQPGSRLRDTDTLHRIDPDAVKTAVLAAGFVFDGALDVLRNPADDHTKLVFDKSIRGHTDQFVFKFHRPA